MTDTTAKIRAKGCDATGLTEDIASDMYRNKGRRYMAIVELKVEETHEKADGNRKVDLVMTMVEPAEDSNLDEHLRELTRTLHFNRGLDGHTGTTTEGQERTVADVMASGQHFRPHPFLPVDASQDNPICDVCGSVEASAQHSQQDVLDQPDTDDEDVAAAIDEAYADEPEHEDLSQDAAAGEPDPWEYPAGEGDKATASTVADPFTAPVTT
ncbi:MAG TPA: hypothetical protein VGE43_08370 [Acidimicrobiales bacterium]